ncbi:MAG: TetR family transcriptional regulator [Kordiimonadales bacterium]|nr:MAG: TetR family transcriptional regulator [Kordiimonadales bacterium]
MSKRKALISAAKDLLWEQGFEAMSPKKVMRLSGAGQGSLYHHFEGKEHLASVALAEVSDELFSLSDSTFDPEKPPMDRLYDYLMRARPELKGCKLGRLVSDKTIIESNICKTIGAYFAHIEGHLSQALKDAQASGDLPHYLDTSAMSKTLQAVIQGGYILARGSQNPEQMAQAQEGAWVMLEALSAHNS